MPTVLVTHDAAEAVALAENWIIYESEHVVQQGTLELIRAHPATPKVASLVT